jgi:hypothetical protein
MKKADHTTDRRQIRHFQQIINVGPAVEASFAELGLTRPQQLIGRDPWQLYCKLCRVTKTRQYPCVLDVLMSTIDYMNGNPPRKWWEYTDRRKREYATRMQQTSRH